MDTERPAFQKAKTVASNLVRLSILEALPESEKREELIQRALAGIDGITIDDRVPRYAY